MDIMQALLTRRSVRRFTDAPVSLALVRQVLEAGRWAPSGRNTQPWRFLVVGRDDPRCEVLAGMTRYGRMLRQAAVTIAVFFDKASGYDAVKDCQGLGACLQNMLLAAHGLNLGAVWLGEIINQEPRVTEALGLDAGRLALMAAVLLGHPAETPASTRKPLDDLLLEPVMWENADGH